MKKDRIRKFIYAHQNDFRDRREKISCNMLEIEQKKCLDWVVASKLKLDKGIVKNLFTHSKILFPHHDQSRPREFFVKFEAWVYAYDDFIDNKKTKHSQIIDFQKEFMDAIFSSYKSKNSLVSTIQELVIDLNVKKNNQRFYIQYCSDLLRMVLATEREKINNFTNYNEYINQAKMTIAVPVTVSMICCITDVGNLTKDLTKLDRITDYSAEVCRLMNDYQTHEREKNVKNDSLSYISEDKVLDLVCMKLLEIQEEITALRSTKQIKHFLLSMVLITVEVYLNQDYREKFQKNLHGL